jgi:prepilin-type N-terminal cleavage/methylation domain-containing protein
MVTGHLLAPRRSRCARPTRAGYSLLELLFVVALMVILSVSAVPAVLSVIDGTRARGAARYLGARLQLARLEAIKRSTHVGLRIDASAGYRFAAYVDGNGDGIRTRDIRAGTDWPLGSPERIDASFAGVGFGILDGVKAVDSSDILPAGSDPVRLGSGDILSFGPLGTATSGTLYLRGSRREQYAVRVLGATGRVRVLRYDFAAATWVTP